MLHRWDQLDIDISFLLPGLISNSLICIRWGYFSWLSELEDIDRYFPNIQVHLLFGQAIFSLQIPFPSTAPFFSSHYFEWWLCFQNESQLHRKQNRTGCNIFPLYHHPSPFYPLAGWVQGVGLLACVLALIGGGSSGPVIFIISRSKITFLKPI